MRAATASAWCDRTRRRAAKSADSLSRRHRSKAGGASHYGCAMASRRSSRRRRSIAVAACVLWLLGVEVLPNPPPAFHADDHTHGDAGAIVVAHVAIADHAHDEAAT